MQSQMAIALTVSAGMLIGFAAFLAYLFTPKPFTQSERDAFTPFLTEWRRKNIAAHGYSK